MSIQNYFYMKKKEFIGQSMDDLTIVLIIGKRKEFFHYTLRWMAYASKNYNNFKIIVADGSGNKEIEEKLYTKRIYDFNYKYIKYPVDKNYSEYFAKIDNALSKVDTEFSVLADDDDFFNKDSLIKSKNFLKNNYEFSTCRGTIGNFKINSKFSLKSINVPPSQQSIVDEEPKERVASNFILNSSPSFYDVHRSELQKKNYNILSEQNFIEPTMVEMLPEYLDVIDGKVHRFNDLYLMRQSGMNHSSNKTFNEKNGGILERLSFGNFSDDLKKWIQVISERIAIVEKIKQKDAYNFVKKIYLNVLEQELIESSNRVFNKNTKTLFSIKKILKNNIKKGIPDTYFERIEKNRLNNSINKDPFLKNIYQHLSKRYDLN